MPERNDGVHFAAEHPAALRGCQRDGHRVRLGLNVTSGRDLDFIAYVEMRPVPDESARSVSTVGGAEVGAHESEPIGGPVYPSIEVGRLPRAGTPRMITQSEAGDVDRGVAESKRTADRRQLFVVMRREGLTVTVEGLWVWRRCGAEIQGRRAVRDGCARQRSFGIDQRGRVGQEV